MIYQLREMYPIPLDAINGSPLFSCEPPPKVIHNINKVLSQREDVTCKVFSVGKIICDVLKQKMSSNNSSYNTKTNMVKDKIKQCLEIES